MCHCTKFSTYVTVTIMLLQQVFSYLQEGQQNVSFFLPLHRWRKMVKENHRGEHFEVSCGWF